MIIKIKLRGFSIFSEKCSPKSTVITVINLKNTAF